jgi:class 3 adenylate cyclase/sensor domain CHASE-containing protein
VRADRPAPPAARLATAGRSLRVRTLAAVVALVVALLAVLVAPLYVIVMGGFASLEERDARQNVTRVLNLLDAELTYLARLARDYAVWDDTYRFMVERDPSYPALNFMDTTFESNRTSLVVLAAPDGALAYAQAYDLDGRRRMPLPIPADRLAPPLRALAGGEVRQGLVLLDSGPLLVGAHPILTSEETGTPRGVLILGRALTETEVRRLSEATRLPLATFRADAALPPEVARARAQLSADAPVLVDAIDGDHIDGYALVQDVTGGEALVLRVPLPREIHHQGRRAMLALVGSLAAVGLVFAVVLVLALDRVVLRRLHRLASDVHGIGDTGDLSARVAVEGGDELAELARRVNGMLGSLEQVNAALVLEQEKSERLLLNILPEQIAARLKDSEQTIADSFSETSVLFADLVGFTQIAGRMPPPEMVALLNGIFTAFDDLADRYGLEKIKTIGDAYMAVAGLPTPRADHAAAVADMALDMLARLEAFNAAHGTAFALRIGIHSGPVVAGVIGRRKFIYDIWGDTVNLASRMESHGVPGAVQVSTETRRQLGDAFEVAPRGTIEVKGKGAMQTYLLLRRRAPSPG